MSRNPLLLAVLLAVLAGCAPVRGPAGTARGTAPGMVVTANPHATEAGLAILRAGGSAVDAAVAIEAVLSLVEPQSSGLGGGGYLIHFDAETGALAVYDGRETAPASAAPDMFLKDDGAPLAFLDAKTSGLSTGVPGAVALLFLAHEDHGVLPWGDLFDHAGGLAVNGFAISPRLHGMIARFGDSLPDRAEEGPTDAFAYFFDDAGAPLPAGHVLKNPDYARTLKAIAADPAAFYRGGIASEIAAMVQRPPRAGGLTEQDLAGYGATKHEALCRAYRTMQICGPPPSSSWLAVGMIMGLLEKGPGFSAEGASDPVNWAVFAEAQRLAYADRDRYVADSAFVKVPVAGLLDDDYLEERAALISPDGAMARVAPGDPWAHDDAPGAQSGRDATDDTPGTTHFVVVDRAGDVVSMTASVESVFGSTRMVGGLFLNNQLTDFSFRPTDAEGRAIANAAAAGKRPRSSMSPTIVLDEKGAFLMATGSPGGSNIIAYTAKTLVGVLDWGLSAQEAVALPNMVARGDVVRLERERATAALVGGLEAFGFAVDASGGENSGLSVVVRRPDGRLEGGVDPRREGVVGTTGN